MTSFFSLALRFSILWPGLVVAVEAVEAASNRKRLARELVRATETHSFRDRKGLDAAFFDLLALT